MIDVAGSVQESEQEGTAEPSRIQESADLEPSKRLVLHFSTANIPHPDKVMQDLLA